MSVVRGEAAAKRRLAAAQAAKLAAFRKAVQEAFQAAWQNDRHCVEYRRLLANGLESPMLRVFALNALAAATNGLAARSWDVLSMADRFLSERESEASAS